MSGRSPTTVVTGASSGIGLALAEALAGVGHRVVLVGRNAARLAEAHARTQARAEKVAPRPVAIAADISEVVGARELARRLDGELEHIDVLVHNAGILPTERRLTHEGFEESFAVNHLAPFVLNASLRPRLVASRARIVQVSAGLYLKGTIDVENGPFGVPFHPFKTYGSSKLWNLLASRALAREVSSHGVTLNAVHPGVVRTRLGDMTGAKGWLIAAIKRLWASPEKGARGPLKLATSSALQGVSGRYFHELEETPLDPALVNDEHEQKVMSRTVELVGST